MITYIFYPGDLVVEVDLYGCGSGLLLALRPNHLMQFIVPEILGSSGTRISNIVKVRIDGDNFAQVDIHWIPISGGGEVGSKSGVWKSLGYPTTQLFHTILHVRR